MEFSFLSTVNKITELLLLLFSDFFQNCFPAPAVFMDASGKMPSQREIISHIIIPYLRLPGREWQTHILLSMLDDMLLGNQQGEWLLIVKEIHLLHLLFCRPP